MLTIEQEVNKHWPALLGFSTSEVISHFRWLRREMVPEKHVKLIHDSLTMCLQMGEQLNFEWRTAQEICDLYNNKRETAHDFFIFMHALEHDFGMIWQSEVLDAWLELFKGVEFQGRVLVRTCEEPFRWGVVGANLVAANHLGK